MADQGICFKLWSSALNDPDLNNLHISDFGRWAKLGLLIKMHGTNGALKIKPPAKFLCVSLQLKSFKELTECFRRFPNCGVLDSGGGMVISYKNWDKYQNDGLKTVMVPPLCPSSLPSQPPSPSHLSLFASQPPLPDITGAKKIVKKKISKSFEETSKDMEFVKRLGCAYPWVRLNKEFNKMRIWLEANPTRQKKNYKRFIQNWLGKVESDGRYFQDDTSADRASALEAVEKPLGL